MSDDLPNVESGVDLPDHDTAHEIMEVAFEHYFMHTEAVMKKLSHAKDATDLGLKEISKVKSYGDVWDEILEKFTMAGLSEDGLKHIESILGTMPKVIDDIYESLVTADAELQELEKELSSDRYKEALDQINEIQSQPNQMSGLGPEEYDIDLYEVEMPEKVDVEVEVYKFSSKH